MSMTVSGSSADRATVRLLTGATAPGASAPVSGLRGGIYDWITEGNFAGLTADLQQLALDGTTWVSIIPPAARDYGGPNSYVVGIRPGASVRVVLSGTPTGTPSIHSAVIG